MVANPPSEEPEDFDLLEQVLNLLQIKELHHLSESALIDILYHRRAFDTGNIPEEWPETFEDVLTILKRVGYVDPNVNTYRICAGKSHTTVFYPEGHSKFDPMHGACTV